MGRKEITTKEDLMKVIELFENTGITYWLDGGWGVDHQQFKAIPGSQVTQKWIVDTKGVWR